MPKIAKLLSKERTKLAEMNRHYSHAKAREVLD